MFKKKAGLFFLCCFTVTLSAMAQIGDTIKKDSIKIDTNLINTYRVESRRNAIPVPVRPIHIVPELIPVTMPDYEVSYWHKWLTMAINFNQSAFSNNWSAGGVNAIALGSNVIFKTEYNKAPFDYTSELNLLYGKSKNKGQSARKTNDRLFFDNKLATQLSTHWFFFGSLTFESQFDNGYQYPDPKPPVLISRFLSPGYLTESIGFEYKPVKYFDLRIGTGTARQTFVLDTAIYHHVRNNYGVKPRTTVKNELAFQVVANIEKDLMQNLHIKARYALFVPYGRSLAYVSHRIDAQLLAKVNRLINVTLNGSLLYDKLTSPKPQSTEGLALGILYRFP